MLFFQIIFKFCGKFFQFVVIHNYNSKFICNLVDNVFRFMLFWYIINKNFQFCMISSIFRFNCNCGFFLEFINSNTSFFFLSSLNHLCRFTLYLRWENIHSKPLVVLGISIISKYCWYTNRYLAFLFNEL